MANQKSNNSIAALLDYQKKLEEIEKEILKLKKRKGLGVAKKVISLKGILKGVKITEKDIEEAKKSLFKAIKT